MGNNTFIKAVLKSPLHGMLSSSIMLITYTGVRSGREYTVPVNYIVGDYAGQTLLVTSRRERVWWRNFRSARLVSLHLRGVVRPAQAVTLESEANTRMGLEEIFRLDPRYARFFKLSVNRDGEPDPKRLAEMSAKMVVVRFCLTGPENC